MRSRSTDQGTPGPGAAGPHDAASGDGATVTKKDLVNRIAESTGETKVVTKNIIQMFLDEIVRELAAGNRLEFRDFGVFEVKARRARRAQNPRTLEKVAVPPKRVVKFKVGRVMRDCVTLDKPFEPRRGDDD
jgi:integration host factor subunit beta